MTSTTADTSPGDVTTRRARGAALIAGAVLIVASVESGVVPRYWFPVLAGLTYLVAAAVSRSRGRSGVPGS